MVAVVSIQQSNNGSQNSIIDISLTGYDLNLPNVSALMHESRKRVVSKQPASRLCRNTIATLKEQTPVSISVWLNINPLVA